MAIEFSRASEDDLLGIFLCGIEECGIAQAERYKAGLDRSIQTLSDNPNIARLRLETPPPVRVYPARKHMIVYTIAENGETVLVLRVRHHRENWKERPIENMPWNRQWCAVTPMFAGVISFFKPHPFGAV